MAVDDIRSSAETARNAIATAKHTAEAAMQQAQELAQDAGARGWEGVAHTVMAAQNALEAVAASLGSGHDAADGAVNAAAEITTKLNPNQVSERCGGVIGQLDAATTAAEAASGSAHEALTYSQQAEADSLTAMIGTVFDALGNARQAVDAAKTVTHTEQQEAATWAKN